MGVPGNEEVDKEAKIAAKTVVLPDTSNTAHGAQPDHIRPIFSTLKALAMQKWDTRWNNHKHGRHLHRLQPTRDKSSVQKHTGLPRPLASILFQMRTGKIGRNDFLFSVKRAESAKCPCSDHSANQTVAHVLMY